MTTTARDDLIAPPLDRFTVFSPDLDDIIAAGQTAMPSWFPPGSGMRRFAAPDDRTLRSGFTVFGPGMEGKASYWFKEVWCVISGTGVLVVEDLVTGAVTEKTVKARDGVYLAEATRLTVKTQEEPLFIFYCATPASGRDSHWVAALGEEDIADARKRLAFEKSSS